MKFCKTCNGKIVDKFRCYGIYQQGMDVWCQSCWKELQDWRDKKFLIEELPDLDLRIRELKLEHEYFERKVKGHAKTINRMISISRKLKKTSTENNIPLDTQRKLVEVTP